MKQFLAYILPLTLIISGCFFAEEKSLRRDLLTEKSFLELRAKAEKESKTTPPILSESPTLSDCLAYAALESPALRAAFYQWQAELEKVPQARALPDPKIGYVHYIREVETRVGAQKNRYSLMQMLPWPTKITSKTDRAVRKALAARYRYDAEKLTLFYRVRRAYAEYYYLGRSIEVVADSFTLLKNLEESLQTRYQTDTTNNHTIIQIQVELGRLEDRLKSLKALQPALASRLNAVMGRKPQAISSIPQKLADSGEIPEETILLSRLAEDNPGLRAAREKVRAAAASERLARSQYLPDFGLSASVIETDRRTDANPDDNGKDPVMVGIEMTLPLWWRKYGAGVREADSLRLAAEAELLEKTNRLTSDLRMAFYNYEDAGRKQNLFEETLIPKAEQALESVRSVFTVGKAGFADLIGAERSLLELRLMSERATVDRAIRLAELEMLSGLELR